MNEILSKTIAMLYLQHEFTTKNLKVTTVLDEFGCFTGKIILEETDAEVTGDADYLKFLAEGYASQNEKEEIEEEVE